ncbi:S53 family peptidase [Jatrophihabitans fulvus]
MRRRFTRSVTIAATLTAAAGATIVAALPATANATPSGVAAVPAARFHATAHGNERTCAAPTRVGVASCLARVVVNSGRKPVVTTTPAGYGPADIRSAYALGSASGSGRTVAIVDAYDDPTAASDLSVYRSQYGLPACTTGNGCFRKVSQTGSTTSLPAKNAGWATEISLDLDMVSAACPDCKILLVEAKSTSFSDLGTAVNYAASQGVSAISNSYGGSDSAQTSAYNHPGIAVTASTGDDGYGIESPASFDSVVAVGGTSLSKASGTTRGWSEKAWSGAGSGCSTLNAKPSWQTSVTQCSGKANADVSAVADPNTGVAVYDSTAYQGASGWQVYGGTSASSPIIASVYTMGGNLSGYPASYTWSNSGALNDVTSGSNGSCSTTVWCNARTGWDGPTGLGTPNGTAAF